MNLDHQPTGGPMFDRDRPYDGQPHTDNGVRGEFVLQMPPTHWEQVVDRSDRPSRSLDSVPEITLRDIHDAVLIGILHAKNREDPIDGRTLPVSDIMTHAQLWAELAKDPGFDEVAAAQNAAVEIEKRLGIYPNVAELTWTDPAQERIEDSRG